MPTKEFSQITNSITGSTLDFTAGTSSQQKIPTNTSPQMDSSNVTSSDNSSQKNSSNSHNKYDVQESLISNLRSDISSRKPSKRKKTLISLVDELFSEINTARDKGVSWDDLADSFNRNLQFSKEDYITGNTLSQAYVTIKKRSLESKRDKKSSNETTEKKNAQLKKEIDDLRNENENLKTNYSDLKSSQESIVKNDEQLKNVINDLKKENLVLMKENEVLKNKNGNLEENFVKLKMDYELLVKQLKEKEIQK